MTLTYFKNSIYRRLEIHLKFWMAECSRLFIIKCGSSTFPTRLVLEMFEIWKFCILADYSKVSKFKIVAKFYHHQIKQFLVQSSFLSRGRLIVSVNLSVIIVMCHTQILFFSLILFRECMVPGAMKQCTFSQHETYSLY